MIKTLVFAGLVTIASFGQPPFNVTTDADIFHANAVNTGAPNMPCYQSEGVWPYGTLQFDDGAQTRDKPEAVQRSAGPVATIKCAVA